MKPFQNKINLENYNPVSVQLINSPRSLYVIKSLHLQPQDLQVPDLNTMRAKFQNQGNGMKFDEFKQSQIQRTFKKLRMCQLEKERYKQQGSGSKCDQYYQENNLDQNSNIKNWQNVSLNLSKSLRSYSSSNYSPMKKSISNRKQKQIDDFQCIDGSFLTTAANTQRAFNIQDQYQNQNQKSTNLSRQSTIFRSNKDFNLNGNQEPSYMSKSLDSRGLNKLMSNKFQNQQHENQNNQGQKRVQSARITKNYDQKMQQVKVFKQKLNRVLIKKQDQYTDKQKQLDMRIQQRSKEVNSFWAKKKRIDDLFKQKIHQNCQNNLAKQSKIQHRINSEAKSHSQKHCNSKFVKKINEINSQQKNKMINLKNEELKNLRYQKPVYFQTPKNFIKKNQVRSFSQNENYLQNQNQDQNQLNSSFQGEKINQSSAGIKNALFGTQYTGGVTKYSYQNLGFDKGQIFITKYLDFRYDNPNLYKQDMPNNSHGQKQWW